MKNLTLITLALFYLTAPLLAQKVRIAEITDIEGVRSNVIRGQGLVVGLKGTGDKSEVTKRMLAAMMTKAGTKAEAKDMGSGNAAAVYITAVLPPFKRPGSRIDVNIASMQDCQSLAGGMLVETRLMGYDGKTVYAIAEGPIVSSGLFEQGNSGSSLQVNTPTEATIPNGAIVEKTVDMQIVDMRNIITLNLKNQDFTTAKNIQLAIDKVFPASSAALNGGVVEVKVPMAFANNVAGFVAKIQQLQVTAHMISKIVIDSRTGVVIAGADVRISRVAVAHGDLTVTIDEVKEPVIAAPFTDGPAIETIDHSQVTIEEEKPGIKILQGGESVASLAASLNALQAGPRQIISILQAIKSAGALHADLEVR